LVGWELKDNFLNNRKENKMFRLLISGSRDWDNDEVILVELLRCYAKFGTEVTLVSGGAKGADSICEEVAKSFDWVIEQHLPDWDSFGKSAGYRRNEQMVASGVDALVAFRRNNSRGTTHTAQTAIKAGVPTKLVEYVPLAAPITECEIASEFGICNCCFPELEKE
jgi:hypothetical protein